MFDKSLFPFDPQKITEMFRTMDLSKMMGEMKFPQLDVTALMAAQKKNMDALAEANKAAAAGYQDLFAKQVAIFEATMAEAQKHMKGFDAKTLTPDGATAQGEIVRVAVEKALANMRELAEAAQKANKQAFDIVSARVKDSMAEIAQMATKLKV
jgi:phasin family protein